MKRNLFFILIFLFITFIYAETKFEIKEFYGGSIDFSSTFYTDSFFGSRGDALRNGGVVSTLDFQQSFTSYNPATLAFQKKTTVSMSFIPFGFFGTGLVEGVLGKNINNEMKKMIDDKLEDAFKDMTKTAGVETKINSFKGYIGQAPAIMGWEGMVPLAGGKTSFGIAREEKFTFETKLLLNGLESLVKITDDSNPLLDMSARIKANLSLNIEIRNLVTSFGLGRQITDEWGIGAVLEKYDSKFYLNGQGMIDGVATVSGVTLEFNTNENNSLDQKAYAELLSDAWGLRLGTSYHFLKDTLELAADFSIQPEMKFNGSPEIIIHKLPDTIDTSDFTKTKEEKPDTAGDLYMKLPSFMRITFAWKPGMILALNYIHYFDPFYLKFENSKNNLKAYLDMMDSFRIGFNFGGYFQLGGGITLAREGLKSIDKEKNETKEEVVWFPLPVLSTGFTFPIGDYIKTEVVLLALPMPVFKTSFTLNF